MQDEATYRHASEIPNKLVQTEPDNQPARDLLADVFEQIGYLVEKPDLTLTIHRSDLDWVTMGAHELEAHS